jgi:glycosyltransferase involved in cell wall biosynthesis
MNTLSVIIITKNEAEDIRQCLKSVSWADEIVVLDSGSSDNTVEICKQYTEKVFVTDWPGFGIQKNRALGKATGDWVLSLDADEWLSGKLIQEIQQTIQQKTNYDAYAFPRLSKFCGKYMQFGAWRHDKVLRLFKRGQAQFTNSLVHEKLVANGETGMLESSLFHDSFKNLEEVINKMNQYSSASAQSRSQAGKKTSLFSAIVHGVWTFLKCYFLQAGFLDGREGFILAVSNAEGSYYRYLKLLYLNQAAASQQEPKKIHNL